MVKNRPTGIIMHWKNKMFKERNPNWKGDKVKLSSLHEWIKSRKPKPELCEECNEVKPYDLANVSGEYKRDIKDFRWLCRKCHMNSDGRLNNLKKYSDKKRVSQEHKKEVKRIYRKNNKERISRISKKSYEKNKEKISIKSKERYKLNKEKKCA